MNVFCVSAAAEGKRGESLHRKRRQEAGHHGPADQVNLPRSQPCD